MLSFRRFRQRPSAAQSKPGYVSNENLITHITLSKSDLRFVRPAISSVRLTNSYIQYTSTVALNDQTVYRKLRDKAENTNLWFVLWSLGISNSFSFVYLQRVRFGRSRGVYTMYASMLRLTETSVCVRMPPKKLQFLDCSIHLSTCKSIENALLQTQVNMWSGRSQHLQGV